jgi:MOSC domain-containing protein YiiM
MEEAAALRVAEVRVGRVAAVRGMRTGYGKEAASGRVHLGRDGFDGDAQADRRYHGGPDMAALAYGADHYPRWRDELAWPGFPVGGFGENLPLAGCDERSVCIGDVFRIGSASVQVASPRKPCSKIARYWRRPALLKVAISSGRTGWYLRVLEEGTVEAGDGAALVERPHPDWPVLRVFRIGLARRQKRQEAADAARSISALSERWKAWLRSEPAEI